MAAVAWGGARGGRLGILLLLLAVLSMHGVQYVAAAVHGPGAVSVDRTVAAGAVTVPALAPVALGGDAGMTMAPEPPTPSSAVTATSVPGHGIPAHVWSLCLAVLLAGIALLGAVLARGAPTALVSASSSRPRGLDLRSLPPRPPDLSVLCLLRI